MMKILGLLTCLVAMAYSAPYGAFWHGFPYYHGYNGYWAAPYYAGYPYNGGYHPYGGYPYGARLIYYGEYSGSCNGAHDGLYYVDEKSFAYCSNGQKTIQPCADGSANPPLDYFKHGTYYGLYDFCAINLVAQGYNGHPKVESYPAPKVEPVYNTENYGDKDRNSQYVKEETYVVEEAPVDGYGDDNKGFKPYEPPKKEHGFEGEYYEKKTYEEAPKPAY